MNADRSAQLLILGDIMLDRYTSGAVRRASPEAPVLVLDAEHEEVRLGGAGAVAALLAGLNIEPIVAGIVGDDGPGGVVIELVGRLRAGCEAAPAAGLSDTQTKRQGDKENLTGSYASGSACPLASLSPCPGKSPAVAATISGQVRQTGLLRGRGRPTTVKERLIGSAAGRQGQQLLRVDRESCRSIAGELEEKLLAAAVAALDEASAVLISDYGKGVCTAKILTVVIAEARKRRLRVLVDPRRGADYAHYRWATLIKPNRHEAGEAIGREIRSRTDAFAAGRELCQRWSFQAAAITLDADGLVLVTADGSEEHFAAHHTQALDVTGAGDTVLAVLGAALARGMTLNQACGFAVEAAGLQVERFGVSPVSWHELTEGGLPSPSSTISIDDLAHEIALLRDQGRRIILANGCFDLFHAGHLHCLTAAKALGDVFVVAINSDASVRRLKGASRPIVPQCDRAALLAALRCVDYVTVFDDDTPERLIAELRPDVLVKGAEVYLDGIPGESIVRSYGGRIELIPMLPGHSTTALIAASVGNGLRAVPPSVGNALSRRAGIAPAAEAANLPLPPGEGRGEGGQLLNKP